MLLIQTFLCAGKKKSTCGEPRFCAAVEPNCAPDEEVVRVDDKGCQGTNGRTLFLFASIDTILVLQSARRIVSCSYLYFRFVITLSSP
jgi:hypothetical protein